MEGWSLDSRATLSGSARMTVSTCCSSSSSAAISATASSCKASATMRGSNAVGLRTERSADSSTASRAPD
jgi:hypothetical protein